MEINKITAKELNILLGAKILEKGGKLIYSQDYFEYKLNNYKIRLLEDFGRIILMYNIEIMNEKTIIYAHSNIFEISLDITINSPEELIRLLEQFKIIK